MTSRGHAQNHSLRFGGHSLAIATGEAMGAPQPTSAMSCDAFEQRLAEGLAKSGHLGLDLDYSAAAIPAPDRPTLVRY